MHGPDWRDWPARLRDPRSAAVAAERARLAGAASFHAWLQWLADEQRAAAQQAARAAGMDIGIIHDLAVGAHPGGADAWAGQDVIVQGVSVGAPPDEFNQVGQDWTLPPWHPGRLAAQGYRPLAGLIDATLGHAGGIRADHVMGLLRLWWVPAGMTPDRGTYVRYDHGAMVGVLASRAARAGALAVGEDLGTVEPWIRRYLADRGVLGTSMLWFERRADGTPAAAGRVAPRLPGHRRHPRRAARRRASSPASTWRCAPVSACWAGPRMPNAPTRPPPSPPGEAPWRGRACSPPGSAVTPDEFTVAPVRLPGPHPGRPDRGLAGRGGGGAQAAEPAGHQHRVPELADPAGRSRRPAGAGRGPGRRSPGGGHGPRGQEPGWSRPAWRSRAWQRSARSTSSRSSMSRRRSAGGGLVRSM